MASLRDAVKDNADELRDGIPWVVFWRDGRSWNSEAVFFSFEYAKDTIDPDDIGHLKHINEIDPRAVALNGYYCGRLGENMTIDELTRGVRWHYENNYNTLAAFIEEYDPSLPPAELAAAREKAHAAGLPFSERPYNGQERDPFVFDGSMSIEDYNLMHQMMEQERSAAMENPLSIQIHNRQLFEKNEPGAWLQLPATTEQLHAAMERVGITADNQQDFFINGIESQIEAVQRLPFAQVKAATVDEFNYLAARLEQLTPGDIATLDAAGNVMAEWDDIHQLLEYAHNTDFFVYIPDVTDHAALGDYYLNKSQMIQMPEGWKAAVDVKRLGQLAAEQEKGIFTDKGYIVESGDEWVAVDRAIPAQYQIMSFPQPEQQRPDPPIEYDAISTRSPVVATIKPPELAAEPQPVIPITLESEKPADKLKEITDKLEQGIAGIFDSEQYKDYLKTLSKFHDYSLNNTILIAMQKPDASLVAGFSSWKKQFERNVIKGQKGIKIIAPSPYKAKKQMEKIDPNTQRPVIGKDGKPVVEEVEVKIPAYKVVSVFDVSQTEGKELPTIGADILTGDVEQYKDFFAALEKASPVPVAFEEIGGSVNGYYHQEDKRIAVKEGMSELQTLKTTIHEIAHARLHDVDLNAPKEEQNRVDKRTREVQAESVAYTVCQHYGLDTSDYSFGYVAGWSAGRELTELKASLETIRTTAAELITEIDGHFADLQQDRAQTAEHEQQPGHEEWSEPATPENAPDSPGVPSDDINAYLPQQEQAAPTFSIYQLKHDDSTRDLRFEPLDRLQAAGLAVDPANYELVYSAPITADTGDLDKIYQRFNIDHPEDFTGHSLSVSDIVTLNRDGQETAHYVDSFGFAEVPQFLNPDPAIDVQQPEQAAAAPPEPPAPDNFKTGERIETPRGSFLLTDMTAAQIKEAGYGYHHSSNDGRYHIMGNGTQAFAIVNEDNPLRTAEMSTEQNYNMIDGVINNQPTVAEIEARAQSGQQINLSDLAAAIKREKAKKPDPDKKPSIRAQLKAGKEQSRREKSAPEKSKDKNNHLEV